MKKEKTRVKSDESSLYDHNLKGSYCWFLAFFSLSNYVEIVDRKKKL